MGESVSVEGQRPLPSFDEKINEKADKVVNLIIELFEGGRVGDVNEDVNTYIQTYFGWGELLNLSKESLIQCLDDKLDRAGLRDNFKFCEGLVLDEGRKVCLSGKYLKGLFKGYFSLIEEIDGIEKIEDLDNYNNQLSKILEFSKSPVMENNIWEGDESCGAHLRNLLSPFKTLIDLFGNSSRFGENFKDIKNGLIPSWKENKLMIDDFCKFLDDKNLFMTFS